MADDAGEDRYALRKKLDGRPMKGVQNLLRSCRRDIRRLSARGQQVFALVDNDAIRHQLKHEGVAESADDAAVVRAPFEGTLYRRAFEVGQSVQIGEPILWLADLSRLRVRANVDQVDLGRVRVGQRLRIHSNAFPERSWSAVVSELVPHVVVKENRSVSEGLALVEPPTEGLVPGMTVDVDIIVEDVADALQVPASAVHAADGSPYVYRVEGGRVHQTPVVLGRASVDAVEILEGLEPDARVVVHSSNGLHDGSRVDAQFRDVAAR